MTQEATYSYNTKHGAGMLTIRGNDLESFGQNITAFATSDLGDRLAGVNEALAGGNNPVAVVVDAVPGSVVVGEAVPVEAPPVAAAPAAAPVQIPSCQHGPRKFHDGPNKNGGYYQVWFCSAQKGDPSQCSPEFINDKFEPAVAEQIKQYQA